MKKIVIFVVTLILATICFFVLRQPSNDNPSNDTPSYDNQSYDKCPKCQSKNIGEFFYGDFDPWVEEDSVTLAKIEEGVLIPGGCVIGDDSPKYRCNDCDFCWGKVLDDDGNYIGFEPEE